MIIAGGPFGGTSYRILHNASSKPSDTFNNITGFDISNQYLDVHYWFDKSRKHKCKVKGYYYLECADVKKFM